MGIWVVSLWVCMVFVVAALHKAGQAFNAAGRIMEEHEARIDRLEKK